MKPIFTNSSKIKKIIFILSILSIGILMVMPVLAYDYEDPDPIPLDSTPPNSQSTGLNITNPLGETSDINALVKNIINFLIILAIPITAILIVYAGFLYITSAGNDEKVKTAQKALIWAIIGFAIVLVASSVPTIIEEFLYEESTNTTPIIYED
ncbi:MAG TPA: pilin [Patescibacteria group bacterium]|nr:pilin [Patescibacteria group bacterium]